MILKSIQEEAADCREACKNLKIGDIVNFLHHENVIEPLFTPIKNRIDYVLWHKSTEEIPLRLRMMRPVKLPDDPELIMILSEWTEITLKLVKVNREIKTINDISYRERSQQELDSLYKAHGDQDKISEEYGNQRQKAERYLSHFEKLFGVPWKYDIFETFGEENAGI